MTSRSRLLAAAVLMITPLTRAQDAGKATLLKIGDPAPALTVGKWIKGGPVAKIEPGQLYVVEFWATWCGPCRESIPLLTELAKKHKEVTFIGQDCWEEDEADVAPFMKKMGGKMDYNVATDDKTKVQKGWMAVNWMAAAGQLGIPTAFLIDKDAKIAWIGHPNALEPVLEKVIAGTYDTKAEANKINALNESNWLNVQLSTAMKNNDTDGVLKASKRLVELKPEKAVAFAAFEFDLLAKAGRFDEARTRAQTVVKDSKDADQLNSIAWTLVTTGTPKPDDLKLAQQAVDQANALTGMSQSGILDTAARVYALQGNWDKAIELEQAAVAKSGENKDASLQSTLEAYRKHTVPPATE